MRILPRRLDLTRIVSVLDEVGVISREEHSCLDTVIAGFDEGYNRIDVDSEKLIFTDQQIDMNIPINIPYRVRSEKRFPQFHSKSIIKGKWAETNARLIQNIEIYCREQHITPTYSIKDRTCLYIARVHYEGVSFDENKEDIERIYNTDKILVNLRKKLDSALGVPIGTVRMNLIAL